MARASDSQKAERLNLARTLLQRLPEAAAHLARVSFISLRQAYRYLEQAQQLKRPVPVGDTYRSRSSLSRSLVDRLRLYATSTGLTLSEIVSRGGVGRISSRGRTWLAGRIGHGRLRR